jgi:hypothetical protein
MCNAGFADPRRPRHRCRSDLPAVGTRSDVDLRRDLCRVGRPRQLAPGHRENLIDPASLAALVGLCRRHGLWLVNGEVYRLMISEPAALPSPVADVYERGISIDAVSKSFGLPGLRVGWVVCYDRTLLAGLVSCSAVCS